MKSKFNVTLEAESSVTASLDESTAKDIISKFKTTSNQFLNQKPQSILKMDNKTIGLKKRKFFKKFSTIKLIDIEKSFLLENCQDLILLYVSIAAFHGYIVLRINAASNMMEFVELLKKSINHQHILVQKGGVYYEAVINSSEVPATKTPKNSLVTTNGYENGEMYEKETVNQIIVLNEEYNPTEVYNFDTYDGPEKLPHKESEIVTNGDPHRHKIIRANSDQTLVTYINYNSERFLSDTGPVALFSQTFPSPYTLNGDNILPYDDFDSDSDSEDNGFEANGVAY